ncbi:hypothetical protein L596_029354 [Steinernema carpocapsae]|uniref:Cytochrome P450 n=1 Tax=Steinernema carpocapsae TaxID=34508 RepID=A0A4U5LUE3_STECR|nr:hypothetical protein L596_029354 [Steinernema carpocapsae]
MTRDKTVVGDYMIPQGVCVTVQMSVTMNDEKDFVNPTQFNPERYIENKCLEKQVIPFGIGKRSCLGESLARLEMFLIITNFVQKYKITAPVCLT